LIRHSFSTGASTKGKKKQKVQEEKGERTSKEGREKEQQVNEKERRLRLMELLSIFIKTHGIGKSADSGRPKDRTIRARSQGCQ